VLVRSNCGQRSPARLVVKQANDDVQHDRTSLFDRADGGASPFQGGFVSSEKWFRRVASHRSHPGRRAGPPSRWHQTAPLPLIDVVRAVGTACDGADPHIAVIDLPAVDTFRIAAADQIGHAP
jgi:hypothetical protein